MKPGASSKFLYALLAVLAIGMGVQTYYLVRVYDHLGIGAVQAVEPAHGARGAREGGAAEEEARLAPDPFVGLEESEERMRNLFEDFYERFDRGFGESWLDRHPFFADGDSFLLGSTGQLGPRVDLQDRGDHYEVLVDVPGAKQSEVEVRVENGMLMIQGSRSSTLEESEPGRYVRRERHSGHFERRLALPNDADASSLETEYGEGVLRITLQKRGGER